MVMEKEQTDSQAFRLVRAQAGDLEAIRGAYICVIDHTPDMGKYARWVYGQHPTDEMLRSYINSGAMYMLLDRTGIAGMMALTMHQGEDYHEINWSERLPDTEVTVVHILAVMPAYQKRGVGRMLMEHAISLAGKSDKKAIRLDALASNLPAHHLYKRLGFAYRDRKHLYAENTGWTDFLFFERKIGEMPA